MNLNNDAAPVVEDCPEGLEPIEQANRVTGVPEARAPGGGSHYRRSAFHYARLEKSPRLQRLLNFLRLSGARGATTFEIIAGARIAAVNSAISELRANGFTIDCEMERVADDGARVYRYTLRLQNEESC